MPHQGRDRWCPSATASSACSKGGGGAGDVGGVAGLQVVGDVLKGDVGAAGAEFLETARGAGGDAGGDEQLGAGLRENHRADVAAVEHGAALVAELALEGKQ